MKDYNYLKVQIGFFEDDNLENNWNWIMNTLKKSDTTQCISSFFLGQTDITIDGVG